jgi:F-type H+-transporting ATPase subunit epsilon
MKLAIVTPLGEVFNGEIKSATFPGSEGEFGVLEGHAPLVTTLKAGVIEIVKPDDSKELIAINWGYVEVTPTHVNVLVDGAVPIAGESEGEIREAIERAKKLIREASDSSALIATVEAKIENVVRTL